MVRSARTLREAQRHRNPCNAGRIAVHAVRLAFIAAFALAGVAHASAREPARYLQLVNRAPDSVMSLATASAGDDAFRNVPLAEPLHGGEATTVQVAGGGCRHDVRVEFRNGRTLVYRDVDVCRKGGLYIDRAPR